jgi:hypothetical protein
MSDSKGLMLCEKDILKMGASFWISGLLMDSLPRPSLASDASDGLGDSDPNEKRSTEAATQKRAAILIIVCPAASKAIIN